MKKWILSAAFLLALSGFATAQTTSGKSSPAQKTQKPVKKGTAIKKVSDQSYPAKKETEAKIVKLVIALPAVDTLSVPQGKNEE
ncbi:MAG TPA: hypothetical protein VFQ73_00240 [Flavisolibacter sp.]|nr:hypothetical protein [Flavisolibacter sp.]